MHVSFYKKNFYPGFVKIVVKMILLVLSYLPVRLFACKNARTNERVSLKCDTEDFY